jgi:gamma-glutamyltranspeptidase / glutathione hydrolase
VLPLQLRAFERTLWATPPNSQGYLALAGTWIAEQAGLPDDPEDERWAFLLVEAARQAAFDRPAVLHEHADGSDLIAESRLRPRSLAVTEQASRGLSDLYTDGGTTYLCAVDSTRMGVSLIMSNAADFGSRLILPRHGIFLHNRGMGFSLESGHPAECGPRRRPPVLSPEPTTAFDTWRLDDPPLVRIEHDAPSTWRRGLESRGYSVIASPPGDQAFGHAQTIRITRDGLLTGAADPRTGDGSFAGR